jgi:hypothetical protein
MQAQGGGTQAQGTGTRAPSQIDEIKRRVKSAHDRAELVINVQDVALAHKDDELAKCEARGGGSAGAAKCRDLYGGSLQVKGDKFIQFGTTDMERGGAKRAGWFYDTDKPDPRRQGKMTRVYLKETQRRKYTAYGAAGPGGDKDLVNPWGLPGVREGSAV